MTKKGIYILVLNLKRSSDIAISNKGVFHFSKGFYLYIGSAAGPGGIEGRLKHHLKHSAKPHWHIDYLRLKANVVNVFIMECDKILEHHFAVILGSNFTQPVKGFGSSDCKCMTHLFFTNKKPELHELNKILESSLIEFPPGKKKTG